MARPPKKNRSAVKSAVVTVKLSPAERDLLDRLVELKSAEVSKAAGQRIEVTAAAYLRGLLEQDALKRGLSLETQPTPTPPPIRAKPPAKGAIGNKARPKRRESDPEPSGVEPKSAPRPLVEPPLVPPAATKAPPKTRSPRGRGR